MEEFKVYKTFTEVVKREKEVSLTLNQYVGYKIKSLRKENGMDQKELSKHLGVTRVSVSNIECGRHTITISNLRIICKLFDASADLILKL